MYAWNLPETINISGTDYKIRTDYRVILDILTAMNDPEIFDPGMTEEEKNTERVMTMLQILYVDFDNIPVKCWKEAAEKACDFIDCGLKGDGRPRPRLMDWEHDAPIIAPEINKITGKDIRSEKMHWWEFFGYYMGIGRGTFQTVVGIREKLRKGQKLEKWERDFYSNNKKLVDLKSKSTKRSEEEKSELRKLFGISK